MMKGRLITFEGVEGCGKSTQIRRLANSLSKAGHTVLAVREPGGTDISEAIRNLLLDPANNAMAPVTELLLYEAARAQLVGERIRPALERGEIVLCDRFYDSTTAYQGAARRLADDFDLDALHAIATGGIVPDLTVLIDLPADDGLARARQTGRGDRMERESLEFHDRVREAFLQLAQDNPDRIRIVDGTASIDAIANDISELVAPLIDSSPPQA